MSASLLSILIFLAGLGQLILVLGSVALPKMLGWREDVAQLQPLTRHVFWVWASYIWGFHWCFALLSLFAPHLLMDKTPLSILVAGFIALYWGVRLMIQFFYFEKPDSRTFYRLAEVGFVALFSFLTGVYGITALGWFE